MMYVDAGPNGRGTHIKVFLKCGLYRSTNTRWGSLEGLVLLGDNSYNIGLNAWNAYACIFKNISKTFFAWSGQLWMTVTDPTVTLIFRPEGERDGERRKQSFLNFGLRRPAHKAG